MPGGTGNALIVAVRTVVATHSGSRPLLNCGTELIIEKTVIGHYPDLPNREYDVVGFLPMAHVAPARTPCVRRGRRHCSGHRGSPRRSRAS
ncbi:hypothetical protein KY5_8105 [Streptomyces formicae]|uniref:Uncharacterized protein n=1 Tax=Streptomyces formicae TaxID=1616117 RepID=A0A291QNL9_9ACTN|nr:hypothetical protein KY5_8105 [Streptomyces formicae]